MGLCRLCLTHSDDFIEIFGDEGRKRNISDILSEYFWFEIIESDSISTAVCQKCWLNTSAFQVFHTSIKIAQQSLFIKHPNYLANANHNTDSKHQIFFAPMHDDDVHSGQSNGDEVMKCKLEPTVIIEPVLQPLNEEATAVLDGDGASNPCAYSADSREDHANNDEEKCERRMRSLKKPVNKNEQTKSQMDEDEDDDEHNNDGHGSDEHGDEKDADDDDDDDDDEDKPILQKTRTPPVKRKRGQRKQDQAKEDARIKSVCSINCSICHMAQDTFCELMKHFRVAHDRKGFVKCCERKFVVRSRLLEHIEIHLNPDAFQCGVCDTSLGSRAMLKRHMETHTPHAEKPFACDKCPARFPKAEGLEQHHLNIHSREEDKTFVCEVCDKKYISSAKLAHHVKRSHDFVPEICDFCGKEFKSISSLNVHRTEVHMGDEVPRMQCKICGTWLHERYLRKHLRLHNAEVETCTVCGKTLQNKNTLAKHIRHVHGDRTHKCDVCDKTFTKKLSLQEHMALHTGRDLYTCPYCPKTFKSAANMHNHRKKAHFEDWSKDRGKRLVKKAY